MDVKEVLQFADELVFAQTGKHLDDIQETVIKGVWQGQTYETIADECNRSESHVRDIGYKLWQILSEQLGEDVNKYNFRSTIERIYIKSSQVIGVGNHHEFNFCSQTLYQSHKDNQQNQPKSKPTSNYHDLNLAPKITNFYDRTTEIQTLSRWLIDQNVPLVSVLGLSGIGKTTVVKQFVDLNLQNFEVVIWKNLKLSQSLDNIINEIITGVDRDSIQTNNKLTQFFNLLRQQRCLIVLDDFQELFIKGELAGEFKTEYKNYQNLLTTIANIEHQSSFILISQEQCHEMVSPDEELYPIKCLELQGLDNTEILKKWGLKDDEAWVELSDLYGGNPVYLKDIANLIKNIFGGKVADFLK